MECEFSSLSNEDFLQQINQRAAEQRIPLSGALALTYRCNLRCVHCYLGDERNDFYRQRELNTLQWKNIIDDITEAGCLGLLLTGGEPFVRKDFAEIYIYAKKKGLLITIFTNGTLIDDKMIALLKKWPPYLIEISVYGATPETYETITGSKNAYKHCMRGIKKLIENQVPIALKTILMTKNQHEFEKIESFAIRNGLNFRFDPVITSQKNGDTSPLTFRVPANVVVEKDLSNADRLGLWKKTIEKSWKVDKKKNALYQCGSGLKTFSIDPFGYLYPCQRVKAVRYNLIGESFHHGWHQIIPQIRRKKIPEDVYCYQCSKISACGYCPALSDRENYGNQHSVDYLCELGKARLRYIAQQNHNHKE